MESTSTQQWEAAGHAASARWPVLAAELAFALLMAGTVFLLARAWLRRGRYRATSVLGEADLRGLHEALAAAERKTTAEILPVVLERSDRHPEACWLAALTALLSGSVGLALWLPWNEPAVLLPCQLGLGALGYACARFLPDFRRFFVSEARAREVSEEQAFQEFHRYELHRTEARSGVLLFVSLLERRVVVLADEGIDARVRPEHWRATTDVVLAGIRGGSLCHGLVAGIRSAGEVLAEHFPAVDGDRNEIPDRVIVRAE
jgi:putative membrane protein